MDIVVQADHLDEEAAAWLAGRCAVTVVASSDPAFWTALADARGLVVRTYTVVDAALLDKAPRLRVVARAGAGLDNIDVRACRDRGVEVVYTPQANTQAVVEYVIGLIAWTIRPPRPVTQALDTAQWMKLRDRLRHQRQMSDLLLGVLGMGRIGRRVAEVARAIGFGGVAYNDLVEIPPDQRFGADSLPVERLFAECDIVSIHVDGRPENRHFVGNDLIARLGPQAILVNTSRGFVVDSLSLAVFLRANPHARAVLDVHETEPFDDSYPLLGLPNARLLPHAGASTARADLQMSWVVRDVVAVLEGRRPEYPAPE